MDKLVGASDVGQADQWKDAGGVSDFLEEWSAFLRRQYPIFLFVLVCFLAFGLVYLFTTPSRYTAHSMLMIDSQNKVLQQQQPTSDLPIDTTQVETQVELLKSDTIALSVIKDMKLTEDSEFVGQQSGFLGAIIQLVLHPISSSTEETASENELTRRALSRFIGMRDVKRIPRTYVLDVSFTSFSRNRAASIADGIAEAYIFDQLESKYKATRRASKWLQERIAELRRQALDADRQVLEFRERKGIVGTGGSDGRLLGEQQILDLNTQLGQARATTAEAKARLDRIQEIMKQEVPDAAVADSLRSDIISHLRTQYLDLSRRYAVWSARYGATHLAAVNLRTQMTELQKSMQDELSRIAESTKSDYEVAKAREDSVEKSLVTIISGTQLTNRDRLGLQDLESNAKALHGIHDNFLGRFMEMTQQLSFPITESRVISPASAPDNRSSPKTVVTLAVAMLIGLIFAFGASIARDATDRVFRTAKQVEKVLRTNCLAVLPNIKVVLNSKAAGVPRPSVQKRHAPLQPIDLSRLIAERSPIYRHVIREPLSSFAEGFRAIKIAADISGTVKENKIIGMTSSLPHEGKSTAGANLAQLIAAGGHKVILVDADLRNPTLSRNMVVHPKVGLLEVLTKKVALRDAIFSDQDTALHFLPAVIESHLAHSSEILASEQFRSLLDELRKSYDYVIVDLPPLAPVVDVRATIRSVDSYVFVVEWGKTKLNMVQRQLEAAPEVFDRLLGVVLNKANMKVLDRYENYSGNYYYKRYYARYGYTQ